MNVKQILGSVQTHAHKKWAIPEIRGTPKEDNIF